MEETFHTKAIIIKRSAFREYDSKVVIFSADKGKVELVARGTKKILSKLAGHLEPITLSDLMIIKGKQFNYIGTAVSEESFKEIKNSQEKTFLIGSVLGQFNSLIKDDLPDQQIFSLLLDFLFLSNQPTTNHKNLEWLIVCFKIKLIELLGYGFNLEECAICRGKMIGSEYFFDFSKSGLICQQCKQHKSKDSIAISPSLVEDIKLLSRVDIKNVLRTKVKDNWTDILGSFIDNYILANVK